jgi:hypothetical protein
MSYDGSGVFLPLAPPVHPAVSGEVIYADYYNLVIADLIAGLTNAVTKDGQSTIGADLNLNGHQVLNAVAATIAGHFVEYAQWRASFISPDFTTPLGTTPALGDDTRRLATTEWVRDIIGLSVTGLPASAGIYGELITEDGVVGWASRFQHFLLTDKGIV